MLTIVNILRFMRVSGFSAECYGSIIIMEKTCKQCNTNFELLQEDLDFYEKMKSPAPNFCWECRMQRRLAHRNERSLYKRTCSHSGKSLVSIYPESTPFPVYESSVWWGDTWDGKEFGQDYDPSRPFFDQWIELRNKTPRAAILSINSVGSEYTNNTEDAKNCYLIFAALNNEDCMYGRLLYRSKQIVDSAFVFDSEKGYELVDCRNCYNCLFTERAQASSDLLFCFDMRDCQNCILSTNLRHEQYMILNEKCTKEEFDAKKAELLASHTSLQEATKQFNELKQKAFVKYSFQTKCNNAVGDYLHNCHDSWIVFDSEDSKNSKFLADSEGPIDCYDMNNAYYKPELSLDLMGVLKPYNSKHSAYVLHTSNSEYCDSVHNSESCFGCIGLKKDSYCILNKQYSKEEYETLKAQIISDMIEQGVYGNFLPPEASPFGYNETLASEYWPMEKDEAIAKGYKWQDATTGQFGKETISLENTPETIDEVTDDILKEVLVDEVTGQNFRITAGELSFYRQMGIPLPRRSFETRHQDRMDTRNPRKLWKRTTEDGKEVWTTYAPDRPETILSEEEYQGRVG